jgi:hypothetical protein
MRRTFVTAVASAFIYACVAAVLLLGAARTASATEVGYGRKFGLGLMFGDPTGFTGKLWVGPTNSLDFDLGFGGYGFNDRCAPNGPCDRFGYNTGSLNIDYLWQSNIVRGQAQLDWHIGAGGRMFWYGGCSGDCLELGARMPVGLDLMFSNPAMLEVFFELAPAFYFIHGPYLSIEGALGVRFYF